MNINELASLTGLSKETIRYYESVGLVIPSRKANGYRDYKEKDVKDFHFIVKLKVLSMTLHDIKIMLDFKRQTKSIKCREDTMLFLDKYITLNHKKIEVLQKSNDILMQTKEVVERQTDLTKQHEEVMQLLVLLEEEI